MTAQHHVEAELDADGGTPSVRFVCTGGPEDVCRQWCAEGCEEGCYGEPIRLWRPGQAEEELVAQAPPKGHRWGPYADGSSCRIVDWLDAVGWQDSGWTDDDEQITAEQIRPGRHLLEEEWTGDDYIWRYAPAPSEVPA